MSLREEQLELLASFVDSEHAYLGLDPVRNRARERRYRPILAVVFPEYEEEGLIEAGLPAPKELATSAAVLSRELGARGEIYVEEAIAGVWVHCFAIRSRGAVRAILAQTLPLLTVQRRQAQTLLGWISAREALGSGAPFGVETDAALSSLGIDWRALESPFAPVSGYTPELTLAFRAWTRLEFHKIALDGYPDP